MRFLKGCAGAWAGICLGSLAVSVFNGSLGSIGAAWAINNLIFAAVGATLIFFFERQSWGMRHHAIAGAATSGLTLFIGFCVIANAISSSYGINISALEYALNLGVTLVMGALAGIGYKLLAGPKAQ